MGPFADPFRKEQFKDLISSYQRFSWRCHGLPTLFLVLVAALHMFLYTSLAGQFYRQSSSTLQLIEKSEFLRKIFFAMFTQMKVRDDSIR